MKSGILCLVDQNATVTFPGACTHRPSHHGSGLQKVGSLTFGGRRLHHFVIHDWGEVVTKVTVGEPAVGSPPYLKAFFEVLTQKIV